MQQQKQPDTSRAALNWAASCLTQAGIGEPNLDAELLLAHCLGQERLQLHLEPARPLAEQEWLAYRASIVRRADGEPVQYIIGKQEFMSLEFAVEPSVLIPRPDTEVLVEAALAWAKTQVGTVKILDLCTGSGAIAISLAHYLENAEVWAGDISPAALAVATQNALRNGVKVKFALGDLVKPFLGETFDLVTANPPYIPSLEISKLQREVAQAEPKLALDGGKDGLDYYRRLALELPRVLRTPGKAMLEFGWDQGEQVKGIFTQAGYSGVEIVKDYAGRDRVLVAFRE